MEEFILAGLLFHVGAAASLVLVSAVSGLIERRRRKPLTAASAIPRKPAPSVVEAHTRAV